MPRGFRGGPRRAATVERLIARDGDRCWYCAGGFVTGRHRRTVDHVVPLALGGTNALANLRLVCDRCNRGKGSRSVEEHEQSPELARRRRLIGRQRSRILGEVFPKSSYSHRELRWYGERRWACRACHASNLQATRSPTNVPCEPIRGWWHFACFDAQVADKLSMPSVVKAARWTTAPSHTSA
jgi:hypothetical protein